MGRIKTLGSVVENLTRETNGKITHWEWKCTEVRDNLEEKKPEAVGMLY